jgi:uncharacterized membrane protein YphA (DoxX/SURF4 family)
LESGQPAFILRLMDAAHASAGEGVLPRADLLAKGLAVIRIFFGLIAFLNGLAKLFSFRNIELGPYKANLIDLPVTRRILDVNANSRGGDGTEVPGLKALVNDVFLEHWEISKVLITVVELGVGAALILGIATRGAALVGLGQHLFLQLLYLSSNRWLFEQPHEWLPLVVLALVPAGRIWGLDGRLVARDPRRRRWPF